MRRTKVSTFRTLFLQTALMYEGFVEAIASSSWKSAKLKSMCSCPLPSAHQVVATLIRTAEAHERSGEISHLSRKL
jgi:hypothetical protein